MTTGDNRMTGLFDDCLSACHHTYDHQGRLVRQVEKTENQATGNWETDDEVVSVYDGWNRIATFTEDPSSVLTHHSSYLWGLDHSGSMQGVGGVGGLLKEGDLYPTYDANGNIMQKIDDSGVVVMSVDYDPFGNVIAQKDAMGNVDPQAEFIGEYGFSTKPLIDHLDWYYYGFRYYDPVTGRWPSRDPILERGGLNLYSFVYNSPIYWIDPLGLCRQIRGVPLDDIMDQAQQVHDLGQDGNEHAFENHTNADGSVTPVGPYSTGEPGTVPFTDPNTPRGPLIESADDRGQPGIPDVSVHNHPSGSWPGFGPGSVVNPSEGQFNNQPVTGGFSGNDIGAYQGIGDGEGTDGIVVNENGDVFHYDPSTGQVEDLGNVDDYEPDGDDCCE